MSDERQRQMLAAYRGAIAPTTVDRARVRRAIAIAEGRVPVTQLRRTVVLAVLAAAATLVLAIAWSTLRADALLGRATPDTTQAPHETSARPEHAIEDGTAVVATTPATLPTPDASPVAPIAAPPVQRHTAPTQPTPRITSPSEAELVRRIVDALDRGAFADVLRLAAEHHTTFAGGTLAPEAQALRILALCELGRDREGRGEATLFLRDHPRTPYNARIERTCKLAARPQ